MSNPENGPQLPAIRWPVPKNNRGGEFSNLEEMLAHLEGEATGHWLIGRNGMWHGGIVINVDQCGAGWSSAFKPVMIAAIDLYQFARTRTPVTWLRDPCGAEL